MKRIIYSVILFTGFVAGFSLNAADDVQEEITKLKSDLAELAFSIHQGDVTLKEVQERLLKAQQLVKDLVTKHGQAILDKIALTLKNKTETRENGQLLDEKHPLKLFAQQIIRDHADIKSAIENKTLSKNEIANKLENNIKLLEDLISKHGKEKVQQAFGAEINLDDLKGDIESTFVELLLKPE
jgi:hypothetical protein